MKGNNIEDMKNKLLNKSQDVKDEKRNDIGKKINSMILPITVENILQMAAGLVSMAMVGRIDAAAVGALGLGMRITQIMWAFFRGIATGASVFVAQAYGAGDIKRLKEVARQTLLSSVVLIVILQQIIYWFAPVLLRVFDPNPGLMESAVLYLRTVSFGLPFMVIMLVVAGVLQGMGNARTPMKIAFIMNLANIVLSFALIFGSLGFSPMGIKGAAVATVSAQFIGAALGLYALFNKEGLLGSAYGFNFIRLDFKQVCEVFSVGIPSSMESVFWQISSVILTRIILSFGEVVFAAYQLGLQAESISFMPAMGFGVAATTFIGQSLGARDKELGKRYLREIIKGALLITGFTTIVLLFFPGALMRLMTNDGDVIKLGSVYLVLMGLVQLPQSMSGVLNGALRGAGFTKVPMIVAGVGIWGIRIPLAWVLTNYYSFSVTAIWVVMCIDLVFRFLLSVILYKTRDIYSRNPVFEKVGDTIDTN